MSGPGTPLPWAVSKGRPRRVTANGVLICNATLRNMGTTAQNKYGKSEADAEANAAFIVRACNNHDALLEALEEMYQAMEYWAGCDEGCSADTASSEIMSSGGAWPSVAYANARAAIAAATDAGS